MKQTQNENVYMFETKLNSPQWRVNATDKVFRPQLCKQMKGTVGAEALVGQY